MKPNEYLTKKALIYDVPDHMAEVAFVVVVVVFLLVNRQLKSLFYSPQF